jgi:anthranilate synthase component 2
MRVLIIDNYDSFTFNLYQDVGRILTLTKKPFELKVIRNDELTLQEIKDLNYDKFIISPGPGDSKDKEYFGVCSQVILEIGKTKPVFGVCLGMQGICHYFGGKVVKANNVMHGKVSTIKHTAKDVFRGLPQSIEVMRYHSLVAQKETIPDCLEITAITEDDGEIMGLKHKNFPISGVQFHPESFATEGGLQILKNFLFQDV